MRLLLSKPDALGDQIIVAGAVQALRRLRPEARIVWHVRAGLESLAPVIGAEVFTPRIDSAPETEAARLVAQTSPFLLLPFPLSAHEPWTPDLGQRVAWWAAFLRATSWDATVLGLVNRNWVGDFTVTLAPAPVRVGFAAGPMRQPFVNEAQILAKTDAPNFTATLAPSFTRHEGTQLLELLALVEPRLRDISPAPTWQPAITRSAPVFTNVGPRVLIAPGVGGDSRRAWGAMNFQRVADALRNRGASVTWIEGPGDAPYLKDLPTGPDAPSRIRFGAEDLPKLLETLTQADLLLCHDTAYVHLAAGVGVPTVAIFGAGQHARFHPTSARVKIVQSEIACGGCQWHCLFDRLVCVADIPVPVVLAAAEQLLAGDFSSVTVPLSTPLANAPEGEALAVRRRLQEEVLSLNADRFARLQIMQHLAAQVQPSAPRPPAPPSEPRLSVIIPMGRPERVASTLASLSSQQRVPTNWEIVLVGVQAAAVALANPRLPIVPVVLAANQLPPRTRCLGVERATGEWLLFVDDDVELAPDFYARFLALLATPPFVISGVTPVGAIGPLLPGKSGKFFEKLTDISNFWAQQSPTAEERDWLYSAALFVRADAYRRSGGFNPELPNGEDVDLTRRIAAAGFCLRYEPSLVARHDHRRDTALSMWRYFWKNGNAARYFFAAHGGACPFSVKTVWLKSWSDLRMNRDFHHAHGLRLGLRAPFVWLNYLIVEASLDWHWQAYVHADGRYRQLPVRAQSDATYVQALTAWDAGQRVRGALRYALAVVQDFANPVRR